MKKTFILSISSILFQSGFTSDHIFLVCVLHTLPHLILLMMDLVMGMSGTRCVEGGTNTSLCNKREAQACLLLPCT